MNVAAKQSALDTNKIVKRAIDIFVSATFLIVLSPLYVVIALLVFYNLGRPIIFKQKRPGHREKIIQLLKFRSLTNKTDEAGELLEDKLRINRFGLWLRETSMDELPSMLNVLVGDLSLVGPRPLLVEYLPLYSVEQSKRHNVKPGLTGWAQVNGRNAISWDQKFAFDIWYVKNQSVWLDLKILGLTAVKVIKRDSIASDGEVGMSKFKGSK